MFQRALALRAPSTINRACLVGVVRDISSGTVHEEPCMQFQLVSHDVELNATTGGANGATELQETQFARDWSKVVKQQFTIRCFGTEDFVQNLRSSIMEGSVVRCVGKLRINSLLENGKRHSFPYIAVRGDEQGTIAPIWQNGRPVRRTFTHEKKVES